MFDVNSVSDQSVRGYILELDLSYPEHLRDTHSTYPLCPEHMTVEVSILSPTLEKMYEFVGGKHVPCNKLISNLSDKTVYVTHYRCLKFYLSHGMQLVCTHRIVSFAQLPFMRPFVEYYNEQRQNAEIEFESTLYTLLSNSFFFGNTCENLRKCVNERLVSDPMKLVTSRWRAKPRSSAARL